jgi:hypothetical protein
MKTIVVIALAALCLLLQGCFITNLPGFYSGYKKLGPAEQERIRFIPSGQPIPSASGNLIYAVNGQSLLRTLPPQDTTLVYLWSPHCHSPNCASLQSVQDICTRKGYQLYVVAEYYDMASINLQPKLAKPLLAVNQQFYKTDYCQKYARLFQADLAQGARVPDSLKYARFYLLAGSRFVRAVNALPDAQPQFPSFRAPALSRW